ncbi:hypothetical protein [Spirosoma litoris]
MKKVNRAFLSDILNPLVGGADMDEMVVYEDIDSNDEKTMKQLIKSIFVPYFNLKPDRYKYILKDSLKYYLSIQWFDFESLMESNLLPFYTPNDPKKFFIWLWEIFWPNENFEIENLSDYYEYYDMYEPLKYSI